MLWLAAETSKEDWAFQTFPAVLSLRPPGLCDLFYVALRVIVNHIRMKLLSLFQEFLF